jgi:SAP domain
MIADYIMILKTDHVSFYSAALTVKQLKELCRKQGLRVTGTKATLIQQLENADRKAREGGDAR